MSSVGLVLGGGGVTGAAFHFGALLALEMATGWDPNDADVVIGTSSGAVVTAVVRSGALDLDALVGEARGHEELARSLSERIYRRAAPTGLMRWVRRGILPAVRRPGIQVTVGSPAPYTTAGIVEWLRVETGTSLDAWPNRPTVIVAYEIESRARVAFGTEGSPDVSLAAAVAASAAVPMVFQPVAIDGRHYADGGVASGTSADLVLGSAEPLDLLIVIAPMASLENRRGARFYEGVVDRLGAQALGAELDRIGAEWPDTDVVVLRPDTGVLEHTRPNPLSTSAAVPAFLSTLQAMQTRLADPEVWAALERHLGSPTRA